MAGLLQDAKGLIIRAFNASTVGKLVSFFKGETKMNPGQVVSLLSKAVGAAASAASNIPQFKQYGPQLQGLASKLTQLSNILDQIQGGGGKKLKIALGGRLSREERFAARQERKQARIKARTETKLTRIAARKELMNARQGLQNQRIANKGQQEALAKSYGINSQMGTFLGFIAGKNAIKPQEIFQTVTDMSKMITDIIRSIDPTVASQASNLIKSFKSSSVPAAAPAVQPQVQPPAVVPREAPPELVRPARAPVRPRMQIEPEEEGMIDFRKPGKGYKAVFKKATSAIRAVPKKVPKVKISNLPKITIGKGHKRVGTREQVWNGSASRTSGGLTKGDLMKGKNGKIISKKMHAKGKSLRRKK